MKEIKPLIIALTLIFCAATTPLCAQTTTQEEYDYVTKGYKTQVEGGLDMKKGYVVKDMGTWADEFSDGSRGFHFIGLYRGTDTKPCAIIAIYEKKDNGATRYVEYYCIPTMDAANLWEKTRQQLNANLSKDNADEVLAGMTWGLMKLSSQQMTQ